MNVPRLRTALIVTGLSLLVWALAESRTLTTVSEATSVELAPVSEAEMLAARLASGALAGETLEVTLRGPVAAREAALAVLRERVRLQAVEDYPAEDGVHSVVLRDVLRRRDALHDAGVGVESVTPASVDVEVVKLVEVEVPVRLELPEGLEVAESGVEPAVVRMRAPAAVAEREGFELVARPDPARIAGLRPGTTGVIKGVPVQLPAAYADWTWATGISPRTVDVSVRVQSRIETLTIERLPVQVLLAPSELGRWRIEIPPASRDLVDVRLSGPLDVIERIRSGEVRPVAMLRLSYDELEAGIEEKAAEVTGLPAGVEWSSSVSSIPVTITRVPEGGG